MQIYTICEAFKFPGPVSTSGILLKLSDRVASAWASLHGFILIMKDFRFKKLLNSPTHVPGLGGGEILNCGLN